MTVPLQGFLASTATARRDATTMNDDEREVAGKFTFGPVAQSSKLPMDAAPAIPSGSNGDYFNKLIAQPGRGSIRKPLIAERAAEAPKTAPTKAQAKPISPAADSFATRPKRVQPTLEAAFSAVQSPSPSIQPVPASNQPVKASIQPPSVSIQPPSVSIQPPSVSIQPASISIQPPSTSTPAPAVPPSAPPSAVPALSAQPPPMAKRGPEATATPCKRARPADELIPLEKIAATLDEHRRRQVTLELQNAALTADGDKLRKLCEEKDGFARNLKAKTRELVGKAARAMEAAAHIEKTWRETQARMNGLLGACDVKLHDVKFIRKEYDDLAHRPGGVDEALAQIPQLHGKIRELGAALEAATTQHESMRQYQLQAINQARFDHAGTVEQLRELSKKQQQLESVRLALAQDVTSKQQQLEHLASERDRAASDAQAARARIDELQALQDGNAVQIAELRAEVLSLQQRLSKAGMQLALAQRVNDRQADDQVQLREQLAAVRVDAERRTVLEAELVQLQEKHAAAVLQLQHELASEKSAANHRSKQLQEKVDQAERTCTELQQSMASLESECQEQLAAMNASEDQLAAANAELHKVEGSLNAAQAELSDWQAKVASLEGRVRDADRRSEQAAAEVAELKTKQAAAERLAAETLAGSRDELAKWTKQHDKMQACILEQDGKIKAAAASQQQLSAKLSAAEVQVKQLQQQQKAAADALRAKVTAAEDLQKAYDAVTSALAAAEEEKCALKDDVKRLTDEAKVEAARRQEIKDQATILQTRIMREERALQQADASLKRAEETVAARDDDIDALRRQIEELQTGAVEHEESAESALARFRSGNLSAAEAALVQEISDANTREHMRMANEIKRLQAEMKKKDAQNKTLLKKLNKETQVAPAAGTRAVTSGPKRQILLPSSDETSSNTGAQNDREEDPPRRMVTRNMEASVAESTTLEHAPEPDTSNDEDLAGIGLRRAPVRRR